MDGRRIRVWLSLFGDESGAAVAEEKEANGSRLRPNRNSIDLVRWCQAIHLAPSVRRRVFYGSASRFPRFSTALPRLRPSLGAGRGREKKTGQLSGRPPNCSLITVPVARSNERATSRCCPAIITLDDSVHIVVDFDSKKVQFYISRHAKCIYVSKIYINIRFSY